ncbi:hypothetical protein KvSKV_04340 [Ketogulonicigenium vulgare]|nr:hypothetical protein KvSKV_04340 [Ketogulonicigenium vulgare]
MQVVAVGGVRLGAQNRAEHAAGGAMHLAQHIAPGRAAPAVQHVECGAIAQAKGDDIHRFAASMFRQAIAIGAHHRAAGITARRLDKGEAAAGIADAGDRNLADPAVKGHGGLAINDQRRRKRNTLHRSHLHRIRDAAAAATGNILNHIALQAGDTAKPCAGAGDTGGGRCGRRGCCCNGAPPGGALRRAGHRGQNRQDRRGDLRRAGYGWHGLRPCARDRHRQRAIRPSGDRRRLRRRVGGSGFWSRRLRSCSLGARLGQRNGLRRQGRA